MKSPNESSFILIHLFVLRSFNFRDFFCNCSVIVKGIDASLPRLLLLFIIWCSPNPFIVQWKSLTSIWKAFWQFTSFDCGHLKIYTYPFFLLAQGTFLSRGTMTRLLPFNKSPTGSMLQNYWPFYLKIVVNPSCGESCFFALMCTPSWYSSNPIVGRGSCTLRGI